LHVSLISVIIEEDYKAAFAKFSFQSSCPKHVEEDLKKNPSKILRSIRTSHLLAIEYWSDFSKQELREEFFKSLKEGWLQAPDGTRILLFEGITNLAFTEHGLSRNNEVRYECSIESPEADKIRKMLSEKQIELELQLNKEPYEGLEDLRKDFGITFNNPGIFFEFLVPAPRFEHVNGELKVSIPRGLEKEYLVFGLIWHLKDGSTKRERISLKDEQLEETSNGELEVSLKSPQDWEYVTVIVCYKNSLMVKQTIHRIEKSNIIKLLEIALGDESYGDFAKNLQKYLMTKGGKKLEAAFIDLLALQGLSPIWLAGVDANRPKIGVTQYDLDLLIIDESRKGSIDIYLFSITAKSLSEGELEKMQNFAKIVHDNLKENIDKLYACFVNVYPITVTNQPVSEQLKQEATKRQVWIIDGESLKSLLRITTKGHYGRSFLKEILGYASTPVKLMSW
ncbi:hypothetical protein DRN63_03950, partial [Nanoarchaeota archaeon]